MNPIRRLTLLATAVLLTLGVPAASGDALRQAGVPVAPGFLMAAPSPNTSFTGVLGAPITCVQSGMATIIATNNVAGAPVTADLMGKSFNTCTMGAAPCTVTATGLPWLGAVQLLNGPPKVLTVSVPPTATISITCGAGGGAVTCTYVGAAAAPAQGLLAAWTDSPNPAAPAFWTFAGAALARIAPSAGACGNPAALNATHTTFATGLTLTP
jgi:hypothetical protein